MSEHAAAAHVALRESPCPGDLLFIVMPAYNEQDSIGDVVGSWYSAMEECCPEGHLVVSATGSTDSTVAILENLQQDLPNLELLDAPYKEHGPKLTALYRYAIDSGADYVFQTDSDGQTDPSELKSFWDMRSPSLAILGNRTSRGDGEDRAFVERVLCSMLSLFLGVRLPDANAPFRLMPAAVLSRYLPEIPPDYFLTNAVLSAYFARFEPDVLFKKISFSARPKGEQKVDFKSIFRIGFRSVADFARFRKKMNSFSAR